MTEMPDLPLVLVEWLDANTDNDPVTIDSVHMVHKPYVIFTLGWLLQEDGDGVTVVNEWYDECFRGRTFVPAGMVKEIIPYKLSKPKKKKSDPLFEPAGGVENS